MVFWTASYDWLFRCSKLSVRYICLSVLQCIMCTYTHIHAVRTQQ
jgi:hypothetical protein